MTMGVQAAVLDGENRVLLVRHSYTAGWHLPGGGVSAGETLSQALARELREETGVELTGPVKLHGIFLNTRYSRRDHIAVFLVREFDASRERRPDWEIRETGFFGLDALPPETSRATRARLIEIVQNAPVSEYWLP